MMTSLLQFSNKRKTHHQRERGRRRGRERERKEIKKSKGVSKVSERAMNHSDVPGWVSGAVAVWSWINRGPLKQCTLQRWPGQGPALAPRGNPNLCQIFFSLSPPVKKLLWLLFCHNSSNLLGAITGDEASNSRVAVIAPCSTIITISRIVGSKIYMRSLKVSSDTLLLLSIKSLITLSIS